MVVTPRTLRESICHCMGLQYFWVITGIGIVVGGVWLIYKARPVNNSLAFSDTKEFILMGPSGQVLTACLAIVLLTGPLHERAGSNTANPFQRYLDLAKREAERQIGCCSRTRSPGAQCSGQRNELNCVCPASALLCILHTPLPTSSRPTPLRTLLIRQFQIPVERRERLCPVTSLTADDLALS